MIEYITGELITTTGDGIILEQGGLGYKIMMPISAINDLPNNGAIIKIYTYLHVREDILALYGFLGIEDLDVFKMLITVSGIGPKVALGVLSAITPDDLRFAILGEDVKTITKAPGIGPKTAKKMILELKDKIDLQESFESMLISNSKASDSDSANKIRKETIEALVVLGYSETEGTKAVRNISIDDNMTLEDLLKLSLRKLI